jgi:hypothetical protein
LSRAIIRKQKLLPEHRVRNDAICKSGRWSSLMRDIANAADGSLRPTQARASLIDPGPPSRCRVRNVSADSKCDTGAIGGKIYKGYFDAYES